MLSIRTQDRMSLVPYRETIKVIGSGDEWYLTIILNELTELGTYATQERALEVLDEIEQHVVGKLLIPEQTTEYNYNDTSVIYNGVVLEKIEQLPNIYQMPKE